MSGLLLRGLRSPRWRHTTIVLAASAWLLATSTVHADTPAAVRSAEGLAASEPSTATTTASSPAITPARPLLQGDARGNRSQWQKIWLHRHGAQGERVAVTFGIPFPPGMLRDAHQVHILDAQGHRLPAHVEPSLEWHVGTGGIRAVRVQMHLAMTGDSRELQFALGAADASDDVPGWPYTDGLVDGPDGVRVPGILATLDPHWMATSLIAGPQLASDGSSDYDRYFATQFEWAKALPRTVGSSWLFDRPSTLFQAYVRTGNVDYLAAASESYRFYMSHLRRTGAPGWPLCGGGWSLGKVEVCDPKYVYVEPILLALGLTGDDSEHDDALIERMIGEWDTGGWNNPAGPYRRASQRFTEREAGLGLLATVSAYEITGDRRYLDKVKDRIGWLYEHQQHNPDGLGDDGSWRNSWQMHENDSYDPATDVRGSSPWMTENIIDGLWHAWLITSDPRIPTMITGFGRYMERYGWIDLAHITDKERDWRNPCSGPDGQISWYWSAAHASEKQLMAIQDSEGWYSDAHNVEMMLPVAAARYFETDPAQRKALDHRLDLLSHSYSPACARNGDTPRRFNWNNRGVGVVQWFLHQFETGNH